MTHLSGQCECGKASFEISGNPLVRAYCHCTICQAYNDAAFADITLFYEKDVTLDSGNQIDFKVYQQPPFVRRGKCRDCGKAAIEKLKLPLLPRIFIVPTTNIGDQTSLPEPAFHMFYHSRKRDIGDKLPKVSGFLSSQTKFSLALIGAMLKNRS